MKRQLFGNITIIMLLSSCGIITARAEVADYCAAYARDFADHVEKQDARWRRRYDNAETSCTLRFTADPQPVVKTKPKPILKARQVIVKEPRTPEPGAAPKPKEKLKIEPQKNTTLRTKLKPGSPEWTAYCTKKYVSFNPAKGTYLSKTGIARKCLITPEQ